MMKISDRFILIGPLPPPLGGDTRHFLMMKDLITRNSIRAPLLVNTSRDYEPNNKFLNLYIILKILNTIFRYRSDIKKVFFMASDRGILLTIFPLALICLFLKKKLYIRICGGSLVITLEKLNYFIKKFFYLILDKFVNKIFVQTKEVFNYLSEINVNSKIYRIGSYPINSINLEKIYEYKKINNFRFLYAGHLNEDKGVGLLLEVMASLKEYNIQCDFAGRESDFNSSDINKIKGCNYLGVFNYFDMVNLIAKYNFLILPTWHIGEGEPGVIIESMEACTPVIASDFGGINDLVDQNIGFLIKPKSFFELRECILKTFLNKNYYENFYNELIKRKNKIRSYKDFWEDKLLKDIYLP